MNQYWSFWFVELPRVLRMDIESLFRILTMIRE
jgi:hypothetical protein